MSESCHSKIISMIDETTSIIYQRQNPNFFQGLLSIISYCQPYHIEKTKKIVVYKR